MLLVQKKQDHRPKRSWEFQELFSLLFNNELCIFAYDIENSIAAIISKEMEIENGLSSLIIYVKQSCWARIMLLYLILIK